MPEVVAIAAVARNGVIGADGAIPWRLKGDLPRFKRLTKGHVLIMGRKTYDSIGRPLPERTTIVITRNQAWRAPGHDEVQVVDSLTSALDRAAAIDPEGPTVIAGGGDIYRAAMGVCDRLEITEVHAEPDGDATFPVIDSTVWRQTDRDDDHDGFSWVTWRRTAAS
ncbi:dihydrofolate reductase [Microlunatus soli]|uniref:Dihydrofolate reductase n=1 Tax=Microlunatus soli TaxID=630515 RepID=A0A1H1XNE0_9ACTN|nr:dihydrofolate reductase [Microlunatus soli]SDT10764.1 dihydrofolate reductase [Microlunatus soli]